MTDSKDIGWMYEGAKSLVNREDYLLGKKVDKNFEKYSDAVNEQKPDAFEALLHTRTVFKPQPSTAKTSALESYVVATEDPLVAVKVKEETRRREVLDNPLVKLKFQKMLKEMMAEKEAKSDKKKKKKKKKKVDDIEKPKKQKKKRKSRELSEKDVSAKGSPKRKTSHSQRARDSSDNESEAEQRAPRRRSGSGEAKKDEHLNSTLHQIKKSHRSPRPKEREDRKASSSPVDTKPRREKSFSSDKRSDSRLKRDRRRSSTSSSPEGNRSRRSPSRGNDRKRIRSKSKERQRNSSSPRNQRRTPFPRLTKSLSSKHKRRHSSLSVSPKRRGERGSPTGKKETSREAGKKRSRRRNRSSSSSSSTSSSSSSRSSSERPVKSHSKNASEKKSRDSFVDVSQADNRKSQESDDHKLGKACSSKETEKEKERMRTFDSHIPEHLRPKAATTDSEEDIEDRFDREERERKKRFEGFGLVGVIRKDEEGGPAENPYELSRKPAVPVYKKPEHRRPLTEEEKQAKLREMAENAAWREAARSSNLKRARLTDEKEEEEDMKDKAPSFIRSQLNSAASDLTVEQRLQSNKKSLQRSHGFMEKKFTSK